MTCTTTRYDDPAPRAEGEHPGWMLHLRPTVFPDAGAPERALRRLLKAAWRQHRIRAVSVRIIEQDATGGGSGGR